jgi:hypothetical protein
VTSQRYVIGLDADVYTVHHAAERLALHEGYPKVAAQEIALITSELAWNIVRHAGSGHIERGFGIPDRAAKRTGGKAVTVGVVVGEKREKAEKEAATDFVLIAE